MERIVSINDSTSKGKMLLSLLKEFIGSKSVTFLTEEELEEKEDKVLLKMMEDGRKSGKADTKKVLKKLGIK